MGERQCCYFKPKLIGWVYFKKGFDSEDYQLVFDMKKEQLKAGLKGRDDFINHLWSSIAPHTVKRIWAVWQRGWLRRRLILEIKKCVRFIVWKLELSVKPDSKTIDLKDRQKDSLVQQIWKIKTAKLKEEKINSSDLRISAINIS